MCVIIVSLAKGWSFPDSCIYGPTTKSFILWPLAFLECVSARGPLKRAQSYGKSVTWVHLTRVGHCFFWVRYQIWGFHDSPRGPKNGPFGAIDVKTESTAEKSSELKRRKTIIFYKLFTFFFITFLFFIPNLFIFFFVRCDL